MCPRNPNSIVVSLSLNQQRLEIGVTRLVTIELDSIAPRFDWRSSTRALTSSCIDNDNLRTSTNLDIVLFIEDTILLYLQYVLCDVRKRIKIEHLYNKLSLLISREPRTTFLW